MAKASKTPAVVETKVVEITPAKVVLELSEDEAGALHDVLGNISGSGDLRIIVDSLYSVLGRAGVTGGKYKRNIRQTMDVSQGKTGPATW